jgi:hypothetical protein
MWDDDDEMSDEEFQKYQNEKRMRIESLPVMMIAHEIIRLTQRIVELIDKENDPLMTASYMMQDAYVLAPKIAGAEGGRLYRIRMENAVIIKKAACNLLASTAMVEAEGLVEPQYLQLLRDEIEKFRLAFLDWINSFDKTDNIDDGWGIFVEGAF